MISSVISPLLWIFVAGSGIGSVAKTIEGYPYQMFIYPGIAVMTVLFTSLFYGVYIIWDRKLDFLKEVLVAPVSRASVFAGKMLGGVTDAMMQGVFIAGLSFGDTDTGAARRRRSIRSRQLDILLFVPMLGPSDEAT